MGAAEPRDARNALLVEALTVAARAEEKAKGAHERLDRMNGSIDRLAQNVGKVADRVASIDNRLAGDDGEQKGRKQTLTPLLALGLAILSPIATVLAQRALE